MAPLDRRAQGLLARVDATARLEQVEPAGEPLQELLGREHAHARGRKLEGQRQVLEPCTEFGDRARRCEVRLGGHRTGQEQGAAVFGLQLRHRVGLLAGQPQQLAARDQQPQVRAGGQELGELGRDIGQVLEVVEHEQQPLIADVVGEAPFRPDGLRRSREHVGRIAERCEWHPEDAVWIQVAGRARCLQREARLADAARTGQRDEPRVVDGEQRRELGQLALAPEERGRGHGQVRAVEALERRELRLAELVDPLRRGEVLQPVLAQVAHRRGIDQPRRRGGDERLPAVAARRDPRSAVHIDADVALVRENGVPLWMPIRTLIGPPASRSVAAPAAAMAPGAVGKATKNASPCVSTSTPPFSANASRRMTRWAASASA